MEAGALFASGDDSHIERLMTRLFRLEAVRTVDVDRSRRAVVIKYDHQALPGAEALQSFSRVLQEPCSLLPLDRVIQHSRGLVKHVERMPSAPDGFAVDFERVDGTSELRERGARQGHARRLANLAMGIGGFGMSVVGIVTPFVPTMPFVLATGYFLANSSPTLHGWFRRSPLFGDMLCEWEQFGGWTAATKVKLLVLTLCLWGITLALTGFSWPVVIAMGLVGGISMFTILRMPTASGSTLITLLSIG